MAISWKWLTVPKSNEQTEVRVIKTWAVRWKSRYGEYSHCIRPEVEVFTSKEEAEKFATALRNAFKLTRHTTGNDVEISENL